MGKIGLNTDTYNYHPADNETGTLRMKNFMNTWPQEASKSYYFITF